MESDELYRFQWTLNYSVGYFYSQCVKLLHCRIIKAIVVLREIMGSG